MAHRALDGDDVAPRGDQAAGEVVAQLVELEIQRGVGPGRAPAVVDKVVVPGLAVFVGEPAVGHPGWRVLTDVLGEDRDQLIRQVVGELRNERAGRWPVEKVGRGEWPS